MKKGEIADGLEIVLLIKNTTKMIKKDKGLADTQEGEFILNESGTTVSTDAVEGIDAPYTKEPELKDKKDDDEKTADV